MKAIKIISGILGLAAALLALMVMLNSPAYVGSSYILTAAGALLIGSILMLLDKGRVASIISTFAFALSFAMLMNHITAVDAEKLEKEYIPEILQVGMVAVIVIITIMAFVTIFQGRKSKPVQI